MENLTDTESGSLNLFENIPAAVILWASDFTILKANAQARLMFKCSEMLQANHLPEKLLAEIKTAFDSHETEPTFSRRVFLEAEGGDKGSEKVFVIRFTILREKTESNVLTLIEDNTDTYRKELAASQFRADILSELKIAKRVQKHLNNSILDLIEGRFLKYNFYSAFYPSTALSGDVMNIRIINRRFTSVFIGDGKGHGVPAAMYSGLLYSYLNMFGLQINNSEIDITGAVTDINKLAHEDFSRGGEYYFFSGIFLIIDGDSTEVKVLNAGHPPGYFYTNESLQTIEGTGPLIGISRNAFFQHQVYNLTGDEVFVFYTDGLSELVNESGELYGETAMREFLYTYLHIEKQDPARLHGSLLRNALEFSHTSETPDDVSILVMSVSRR